MIFSTLTIALAALSLPRAHAASEFANHGTLSGWPKDQAKPEAKGTRDEVTNTVYRGNSALKYTQTYQGTSYTGRYHSESKYDNGYRLGDTKFYGFAFRLQNDWQFEPAQSYNIAQWGSWFTGICGEDYMPSSMVWVEGTNLYTRIKTGQMLAGKPCASPLQTSTCGGSNAGKNCQTTRRISLANNIKAGVWYKLTFQINWKSDAAGEFKVWLNGTKVHAEGDAGQPKIPTTILDDRREYDFRVGLYANGWHDNNHEMKGTQPVRQVWIDEIGIGSEFADADPDRL